MLDPSDVVPGLCKRDPLPLGAPVVDVVLAGVVGGERGALVVVLVEQVPQVPGAVAHVDLRVVEVGDAKPGASCVNRDALRGGGKQLHQADRARARARARAELALLVDHARQQRGVEPVVARVAAHDRVVVERVADSHVPPRLGRVDVRERPTDDGAEQEDGEELLHPAWAVSSFTTSPTKASSSSSELSFTYAKSAWATLTVSGSNRGSRSSVATFVRSARTFGEAVTTTTASKRS